MGKGLSLIEKIIAFLSQFTNKFNIPIPAAVSLTIFLGDIFGTNIHSNI